MKLLIDNALSPHVASALRDAGHDAVHVCDRGPSGAPDARGLELAAAEDRVLVFADTDFSTILARSGQVAPSVVQFRRGTERRPERQVGLLLSNLPALREHLEGGAIITIEQHRIRARALPV